MPVDELIDEEKKPSYTLVFKSLKDRDKARGVLQAENIRFRTGKTLVPFRLSGNCEWGVPVPTVEGLEALTFWVWPESLWAPISFSRQYLKNIGAEENEWKKWWNDENSAVYQFIGEDNIYFYGIAEMAMFLSYFADEKVDNHNWKKTKLPHIIANKHILFMNKKASSSSDIKPPMAAELLDFYTAEQLRIHFLSLGLANKNASFQPNVYLSDEEKESKDPVLKEGNLLTNVLNRLARSCFYTTQSYFDGIMPRGEVSEKVLKESEKQIFEFERHIYNHDFHRLTYVLDEYIRFMNKLWASNIKQAEKDENNELRAQTLVDCFYGIRVAITLLHSIAPTGCEMLRDYLQIDERVWDWKYILEPLTFFCQKNHKLKFLEPRVDFFSKHESQFLNNNE
ncbi:MAG: class I tRNA ligase family protein, partial [Clostridia bacterium]